MRYEIKGGTLPVVICQLESGEKVITQGGGMSWMSSNLTMETSGGGMKKMFGRMFTGESMFQNIYTSKGGPGMIAMAASLPGCIRAFNISPGNEIVVQKRGFLASEAGVNMNVFFQKKGTAGIFSGEGFIMQKLSGNGIAFVEFDGYVEEYDLEAGEQIVVDTGHLAAVDASCSIDVQTVKGMKNVMFGGEGLFNTVITGPGKVYLQTMTAANLASAVAPYIPTSSN